MTLATRIGLALSTHMNFFHPISRLHLVRRWIVRLLCPLIASALFGVVLLAQASPAAAVPPLAPGSGGTVPTTERAYGFDVRQPFIDHDATALLGDPAYKIVTTYIAIGNRLATPLAFSLKDLVLTDAYDPAKEQFEQADRYTETVTPIWTPVLKDGDIAAGAVVGGYVSWKVPWYVWPMEVGYHYQGLPAGGSYYGWMGPIFSDMNAGNRLYVPVGRLLYRGIVAGYADGTFRPYEPITVAQFAKMLVLAAAPQNKAAFIYPAGYFDEATRAGLATWGAKDASESLTRLEVALAIARAGGNEFAPPPPGYELPFTDIPSISAGALEAALARLAYNGVVSGVSATRFDPQGACSRGQAAKMLSAMLHPSGGGQESVTTTTKPILSTTTTLNR